MKARTLLVSLTLSLGLAAPALALDWSQADALFNQRKDNRAVIAQARTAYLGLLNQATTKADKLRAVAQLGRLAVYEGEMVLPKNASADRKAVFSQCWCAQPRVSGIPPFVSGSCSSPGFVDKISPAALGEEHPAYFYFHGVCLAYWGEQGTLSEKLAFTPKVVDDIEKGQTLDTRYEGGGIGRLAAGVYSNPAARPLGLYKPNEALELIDAALAEQPFPGDPSNGSSYYDNWQGKASVLIQLHDDNPNGGFRQQGIDMVTDKLTEMEEKIADDDLPAERSAEFHFNYKKLKEHYRTLTGQDWPQ